MQLIINILNSNFINNIAPFYSSTTELDKIVDDDVRRKVGSKVSNKVRTFILPIIEYSYRRGI